MQQDYFLHIQLSFLDASLQQSKPETEHLKSQKIQRSEKRYETEFFYQQIIIQKDRELIRKDRELVICKRQIQELSDRLYESDLEVHKKNQEIRFLKERLSEPQDVPDNRSLADLLDISEEYE